MRLAVLTLLRTPRVRRTICPWTALTPHTRVPVGSQLHPVLVPPHGLSAFHTHAPCSANKGKASKGGKADKPSKAMKEFMEDVLSDGEDDEDEPSQATVNEILDAQSSPAAHFLARHQQNAGKHHPDTAKGRNKAKSGHTLTMTYQSMRHILDIDQYWTDLDHVVGQLQKYYLQNFSLRSATAVDELLVDLEGDQFPLKEVASISKKDPKRIVIDCQAFPQAAVTIIKVLQTSGLNLNPQQEGLRIYVPMPKITREHREQLADGAKKKQKDFVEDLRQVYRQYTITLGELELKHKVTNDEHKVIGDVLLQILHHFMGESEKVMHVKVREILGK
ncbi:hypothetical protein TCAL_05002 [Tigriopus californicus]|uniref:Ribosome-recycling factor, mitochondrial n=1 Tax=Tigriopus californicus TaxID=6832 RepID=A0A553PMN5_TIGCA|nr:ribosome-recycling factor, mitochondrial-like [Tigriopus californicus]TRY78942.1 hypothetical protein TCAL_05002 [Tigriopus californicus]|eukprot:TCALIF_05002-PA protein Name:"Similar to MRRF Ribosome-recycling factor, mitochondrial (Bos taurus)" AED:0.01 eAED:0.01 QI:119/1/1/1/1/1/3/97/332